MVGTGTKGIGSNMLAMTSGFAVSIVSMGLTGWLARLEAPKRFQSIAIPVAISSFACHCLSYSPQCQPLNWFQKGYIAPAPLVAAAFGAYVPEIAPKHRRVAFWGGNLIGGAATLAVASYVTPVATLAVGVFSSFCAARSIANRYR